MRPIPTAHFAYLASALLLGLCMPTAAKADLVFRFHNQSNVEAKGIMHNVGIVWLRRGQAEAVRQEGAWTQFGAFGAYCIPSITCKNLIFGETIALFNHLQDGNSHEYCKWTVKRDIVAANKSLEYPNEVRLTVTLVGQDPAYICSHSGQFAAKHSSTYVGEGLTLDFSMKNK